MVSTNDNTCMWSLWHRNTNGPISSEWIIFHRKCLSAGSVGTRRSSSSVTIKHPLFLLYSISVEDYYFFVCVFIYFLSKDAYHFSLLFVCTFIYLFWFSDLSVFFLSKDIFLRFCPFYIYILLQREVWDILLTMLAIYMPIFSYIARPVLEPHTRFTYHGSALLNCTSTVAKTWLLALGSKCFGSVLIFSPYMNYEWQPNWLGKVKDGLDTPGTE